MGLVSELCRNDKNKKGLQLLETLHCLCPPGFKHEPYV